MGNDMQLPENLGFEFETEEETLKRLILPKIITSQYFNNQNNGKNLNLFTLDDFKSRKKKKLQMNRPIFVPKYFLEFNQELKIPENFNLIPKCSSKKNCQKVHVTSSIIPKNKSHSQNSLSQKISTNKTSSSNSNENENESLITSSSYPKSKDSPFSLEYFSFRSIEKDDSNSFDSSNLFLKAFSNRETEKQALSSDTSFSKQADDIKVIRATGSNLPRGGKKLSAKQFSQNFLEKPSSSLELEEKFSFPNIENNVEQVEFFLKYFDDTSFSEEVSKNSLSPGSSNEEENGLDQIKISQYFQEDILTSNIKDKVGTNLVSNRTSKFSSQEKKLHPVESFQNFLKKTSSLTVENKIEQIDCPQRFFNDISSPVKRIEISDGLHKNFTSSSSFSGRENMAEEVECFQSFLERTSNQKIDNNEHLKSSTSSSTSFEQENRFKDVECSQYFQEENALKKDEKEIIAEDIANRRYWTQNNSSSHEEKLEPTCSQSLEVTCTTKVEKRWSPNLSGNSSSQETKENRGCSQYFLNSSPNVQEDNSGVCESSSLSSTISQNEVFEEIRCSQYFSQENTSINLRRKTETSTGSLFSKVKKNLPLINPMSSNQDEFCSESQQDSKILVNEKESISNLEEISTSSKSKISQEKAGEQFDFNLDNASISCSQYFVDETTPKIKKKICDTDKISNIFSRSLTPDDKLEPFGPSELQKDPESPNFSSTCLLSPNSQHFLEETSYIEKESSDPNYKLQTFPTKNFSQFSAECPKESPSNKNKIDETYSYLLENPNLAPNLVETDEQNNSFDDDNVVCSQYFSQEYNLPEENETTSILSKLRTKTLQVCSLENSRITIWDSSNLKENKEVYLVSSTKNLAVPEMETNENQQILEIEPNPDRLKITSNTSGKNSDQNLFLRSFEKIKDAENLIPKIEDKKIPDNNEKLVVQDSKKSILDPSSSKEKIGTPLRGKKKKLIRRKSGSSSIKRSNNLKQTLKKDFEISQKKLPGKRLSSNEDKDSLRQNFEDNSQNEEKLEEKEELQFTKEFLPNKLHKFKKPTMKSRRRIRLKPSDSPKIPPGGLKPLWTPPKSPHCLIEEDYVSNPWGLLVATIFLNKTSGRQAKPYIDDFLKKYPTPESVISKKPEDFECYFEELGLKKRSEQIWKMSKDFLEKNWRHAKELHGIGKYGDDAFRLFCIGDLEVEPDDRYLKIYHRWITNKDKSLNKETNEVTHSLETP